jgi:hypothetical protein
VSGEPYEGTQLWFAGQAIHEQLADSTVELRFGREWLNKNDQRRRIVWVRPGGTTNPPGRGGGLYRSPAEVEAEAEMVPTGEPVEAPSGTRVQFCYEPVDQAFAHIYAENDSLLEQLFYKLLAAIKLACGHHATPGAYAWPNEFDGSLGKRQPKIELRVDFTFAAPEEIAALVIITSAVHTHRFEGHTQPEVDDEHE